MWNPGSRPLPHPLCRYPWRNIGFLSVKIQARRMPWHVICHVCSPCDLISIRNSFLGYKLEILLSESLARTLAWKITKSAWKLGCVFFPKVFLLATSISTRIPWGLYIFVIYGLRCLNILLIECNAYLEIPAALLQVIGTCLRQDFSPFHKRYLTNFTLE